MHQSITPCLSQTIWPTWASRHFLTPYSPDFAPCDFWLFSKLRGCRYETIEEMKEAVMKIIDTLTQEDFHGTFQKLLERYNKCIAARGDYFEEDSSFMCILSIKVPIWKKVWKLIESPSYIDEIEKIYRANFFLVILIYLLKSLNSIKVLTSEVGLNTDWDLAEPSCLRNNVFYTSTIPEVMWYEPLYNKMIFKKCKNRIWH